MKKTYLIGLAALAVFAILFVGGASAFLGLGGLQGERGGCGRGDGVGPAFGRGGAKMAGGFPTSGVKESFACGFDKGATNESFVRGFGKGMNESVKQERESHRQEMTAERQEHMDAVESALDACDYDAWAALMSNATGKAQMLEKVTSENFQRFCDAHSKMQEAKAIFEELGVGRQGFGKGGRASE